MSERRLRTFDERLAEIGDTKGSTVRICDLEVDDRVDFDVYVVAGDDGLSANGCDLNLDIDDFEGLCADVYLDETGIDGSVKVAET
jgi:hypothetical protein